MGTGNALRNTSTAERRSALTAFLAAAPASLGLWLATLYVHEHVTAGPVMAAGRVPYMIMGGVLFGVPIVIGLIVLIAWPALLVLRRTIGVTLPMAIFAGAACGLVVRQVVAVMWAQPELSFLPVSVVLVTGAGTGWVWWRVWSGAMGAGTR